MYTVRLFCRDLNMELHFMVSLHRPRV